MLTYELTVLDSSGRPVPLTDYGKRIVAAQEDARNGHMRPFPGQVASFELQPGQTRESRLSLGIYQFQPWRDYTVQVRYSLNMPKFDGSGKVILQRELSYTLKAKGGVMAP